MIYKGKDIIYLKIYETDGKKIYKIHSRFRDGKILGELMWKKEKCRIQLQQEPDKNKKAVHRMYGFHHESGV